MGKPATLKTYMLVKAFFLGFMKRLTMTMKEIQHIYFAIEIKLKPSDFGSDR